MEISNSQIDGHAILSIIWDIIRYMLSNGLVYFSVTTPILKLQYPVIIRLVPQCSMSLMRHQPIKNLILNVDSHNQRWKIKGDAAILNVSYKKFSTSIKRIRHTHGDEHYSTWIQVNMTSCDGCYVADYIYHDKLTVVHKKVWCPKENNITWANTDPYICRHM